jgi:hypothetical protein
MASATEKVLPHLESMQPDSILDRVHGIEKYDRMARRNYGLSENQAARGTPGLKVLGSRRVIVAVDAERTEARPEAKELPAGDQSS